MIKNLLFYVKYPAVAGILGVIWIGTAILITQDKNLPIGSMITINIVVSLLIGFIGLRVEKN